MLIPEAVLVPAAEASMMQITALVASKVAISVLVGTCPRLQLVASLQTEGMGLADFQVLMVDGTQRSSSASSRGRNEPVFVWRWVPRTPPTLRDSIFDRLPT